MCSLNNIHVFMVSFPAQGHVKPLLRLGKRLTSTGLFVTLCTSEYVGERIRKANNITNDEPVQVGRGMIRFEFFEDGWDFNSPDSTNLTKFLAQLELVGREKLPKMIRKQADSGRPVSCLINNPFIPWVTDVAEEMGIPSAMLWVQSCASFSAYYHYHHKLVPFPDENNLKIDVQLPCVPLLKYDEIPSFLNPGTPYPFLGQAILGQFKNLSKLFCVLMDTFYDLEPEIVDYMSKISCPVMTIGPIFKESESETSSNVIRGDVMTAENCLEWLDSKQPGTVVYISFGSIVHLKQEQVEEFAHGLSSSGVNFLWVLKPPPIEMDNTAHVLPDGFLEKVGDKGKIVTWCLQEEVLAHPSTACFLTHCGWNSTMEALAIGVPVLTFPWWGDQVTDAKFLVDVFKVGIRMSRGEAEEKIVAREVVEKCVKAIIEGPEAVELKSNALKWKKVAEEAVVESGSSHKNMRSFVDKIVQISKKMYPSEDSDSTPLSGIAGITGTVTVSNGDSITAVTGSGGGLGKLGSAGDAGGGKPLPNPGGGGYADCGEAIA